MATLEGIRQKMLEMAPQLGSTEAAASGTGTTVVINALATGSISAQKYIGWYILRPDAALAADRAPRVVTNYASSTGTLTHAGTAYTNNPAASEVIELHRHNPTKIDRAINYAVGTTRLLDIDTTPTIPHMSEYDLAPFSWIQEEDDVMAIGYRASPVVSRNRHFEKWAAENPGASADHWTLAGAGSSISQLSTPRRGRYGITITRSGADVTLTQTIGLLDTGVSGDSLRGQTCTLVLVSKSSTASHVRAAVADGTQTVTTGYHTGGGAWEEATNTIVIPSTATTLTIEVQVNTSNAAASVDECYLIWGSVTDSVRRDYYPITMLNRREWRFGQNRLSLCLPPRGRGGQYVVYSQRPVPGFTASKIAAGTADADAVNLPTDTAAIASLARFYRNLMSEPNENTTRFQQLAGYWEQQREYAQEKLLRLPGEKEFGISFAPPVMAPSA